jgi:predicted nucleotidyltransferase component of viral defense system
MLYYSTIYPQTLQLLENIQTQPGFESFYLVGGTSLALQIGHRISVDLDLFAYSDARISLLEERINQFGEVQILNKTEKILNLRINDIKVDFVNYRYPFIEQPLVSGKIKLSSIPDISAMKLAAITGRGSKKDFVDLYFLLKKYSLKELFQFYQKKYPDGSEFLVFKSLTYFEDAELEPMPQMLSEVKWEEVKATIIEKIKADFP